MAVRSYWTKSENFQPRPKLPSCVFCRSMSLNVSAGRVQYALTFAFIAATNRDLRPPSVPVLSAVICFTA